MLSEEIHIVGQAHRCVTWPCSMQIIESSLFQETWIKFTYTTLPHNGREEPDSLEVEMVSHWLTSLVTPRVALKDNTPPSLISTLSFIFTCTYLLCSSRNILAENICRESFMSSFLRLCDVLCSPHSSHHMIKWLWSKLANNKTSKVQLPCNRPSSSRMMLAKLTIYSLEEEEREAYSG